MAIKDPILEQMRQQSLQWEQATDQRSVFLSCYALMTDNMLLTLQQGEFHDPVWVDRLLRRFASYYFTALEAYNRSESSAPAVWRVVFDATRSPEVQALQHLLLGVNTHINYDLVLTLVDLLEGEWETLSAEQRSHRYADHCHVNEVIGRTIDAVQDQIIEPRLPALDLVDHLFGPVDEWLTSRLIRQWREQVWRQAEQMLETFSLKRRDDLREAVESETLRRSQAILNPLDPRGWNDLL